MPDGASPLPLKDDIATAQILSISIAVLMGVLSLAGLIFSNRIYPSEELIRSFLTNDLVNLILGLPILLGSIWLIRQGELIGLFFLSGALLYVLYNYIAYLFGIPFSLISVMILTIVLLSAYTMLHLLKNIDGEAVQAQFAGSVPERIAGWVLVVFGIVFLFRAIGVIAQAITNQTMLPVSEIGVLIADLVISVVWVAGGVLLLRRMPLGYASGMGLLFAASMLFVGLILFLLLQPVLTDAPFAFADVVVVGIMGCICFIPFGLFVRGMLSKGSA